MPRKHKRDFTQFQSSAILNTRTFDMWYDRLLDIAVSCFTWENLPDTVDERFLEMTLTVNGFALFFQDPVLLRFLALPAELSGEWDVYNRPIFRQAFASNGYRADCDNLNSVIIYDNYIHSATANVIELYALRLTELQRTIDVNVKAQKTPVLITGTENQRLTLKNLYMEYDGNQPFIFGNKDAGLDQIQALTTAAPLVAPQLTIQMHQVYNEYLTFLGIENSNEDKKERLVSNEVGSNYGAVEMQRRTRLNARQLAAEEINRMFGLDVSVRFNSNLATTLNTAFMGAPEPDMPDTDKPEEDEGEMPNE